MGRVFTHCPGVLFTCGDLWGILMGDWPLFLGREHPEQPGIRRRFSQVASLVH